MNKEQLISEEPADAVLAHLAGIVQGNPAATDPELLVEQDELGEATLTDEEKPARAASVRSMDRLVELVREKVVGEERDRWLSSIAAGRTKMKT